MKYIKIFENFQNIIDDIFSISYLITDIGLDFKLSYHKNTKSGRYRWIDCEPGDKDLKNENQYKIQITSRSQEKEGVELFKNIKSNPEFIEFMDRLNEVCSNYFHVELSPLPPFPVYGPLNIDPIQLPPIIAQAPWVQDTMAGMETRIGMAIIIRIFNKKDD